MSIVLTASLSFLHFFSLGQNFKIRKKQNNQENFLCLRK